MIALSRRYRFPAAHVLASETLSDEDNQRIFGKCANPRGHGHDYGVVVTVVGQPDARTGEIVPVAELDAAFEEAVREPYSHRFLNALPRFAGRVPTAEVIAQVLYEDLERALARRGARLWRVQVVETPRNLFEYGAAEAADGAAS